MVIPRRRPSAASRIIHLELERRSAKPLAPMSSDGKKPSTPPPPPPSREGAHDKFLEPLPHPVRELESLVTSSVRSSSAGVHPPPPSPRPRQQAPPCASFAVSSLPPLPLPFPCSRAPSRSASVTSAAARSSFVAPAPPPPPTIQIVIDEKTEIVIDPETRFSGSFEVIYEGDSPPDNPFSIVNALAPQPDNLFPIVVTPEDEDYQFVDIELGQQSPSALNIPTWRQRTGRRFRVFARWLRIVAMFVVIEMTKAVIALVIMHLWAWSI